MRIRYINCKDFGEIHLLPECTLWVKQSCLNVTLMWWVFRVDIISYKQMPKWCMKLWYLITFRNY